MFDTKGGLHKKRNDIEEDRAFYRKWEICRSTNPACIDDIEAAVSGADVLIAAEQTGSGCHKRLHG